MDTKQQNDFKSVKGRLSKIQLDIKKDLEKGLIPNKEDAGLFTRLSEEMERLCQDEWRLTMEDYVALLGQFQAAMEGIQPVK